MGAGAPPPRAASASRGEGPGPAECLDEEALFTFAHGLATREERAAVEAHIDWCARCRQLLAEVASSTASSPRRIGRYAVLERAGSGSMGEVFVAFDHQLERRVALKLLRPESVAVDSEARSARLLREAQALARLHHPNVVTVYEVGSCDDGLYLAMEYVAGGSLRAWLAAPRPWAEVLAVFLEAGRGLAAAHEVGLVHRDVKPENVLVSARGEVKVTDFGLAHLEAVGAAGEPVEPPQALTATGALLGTPAYMAPAQLEGAPATPGSDQFGFCVALFEGLTGRRPFEGTTVGLLAASVRAGVQWPDGRGVPAWLQRVVTRGLSAREADRYPSMLALVEALDAGRRRRAQGRAAAALAAGLVVALWGVGWRAQRRCQGAERHLVGVWDEVRRAEVRAAFGAGPVAARALQAVEQGLDAYAAQWAQMHTAACEATAVRGEQTEAMLGLRMVCLDGRRRELQALVGALSQPTEGLAEKGPRATAGLSPIDDCANQVALAAPVPLPTDPTTRAAIDEARARLASAKAARQLGRYAEAEPRAREVVGRAEALAYAPLLAEALLEQGETAEALGRHDEASTTFKRAAAAAVRGKVDPVAVAAWASLVFVEGYWKSHPSVAADFGQLAEAALERIGGSPGLELRLERALGATASKQGRYEEAAVHLGRALQVARGLGTELELARALSNWGALLRLSGRAAEAEAPLEEALALQGRLLGPEHPELGSTLQNLASALADQGRLPEAEAQLRRVLELYGRQRVVSPDLLAKAHFNLAEVLRRGHHPVEAAQEFGRSYEQLSQVVALDDPQLLATLVGWAVAELEAGAPEVATALLEPKRALWERAVDPNTKGNGLLTLARAWWARGERASAVALARQALAAFREAEVGESVAEAQAWLDGHRLAPSRQPR